MSIAAEFGGGEGASLRGKTVGFLCVKSTGVNGTRALENAVLETCGIHCLTTLRNFG